MDDEPWTESAERGKWMAIPALEANGYLPGGRHTATEGEVKAYLVDPFPTSSTRSNIFEGWIQHRRAVKDIVPIKSQWLDGSFVTSKVDPADIDVVTFFDAARINSLPKHRALLLQTLMLNKYTRAFWRCDSFPLPEPDAKDPGYHRFVQARDYWDNQWGHDRSNVEKGYLEVL